MALYKMLASAMCALAACASAPGNVQKGTEVPPLVANAPKVRIEAIKIHSSLIAGNLLGTSAERDVYVVLPPSYDREPKRRYPVVYALHGFSISAEQWMKELHAPATVEAAFARGTKEMILVFPNSKNEYGGAFYTNSVATGDFEGFVADELIAHIDKHYRTIARPEARGLVGHSMGVTPPTVLPNTHSHASQYRSSSLWISARRRITPRPFGWPLRAVRPR